MGEKDLTAKDLESRPEVFADIINALIYEGGADCFAEAAAAGAYGEFV